MPRPPLGILPPMRRKVNLHIVFVGCEGGRIMFTSQESGAFGFSIVMTFYLITVAGMAMLREVGRLFATWISSDSGLWSINDSII